MQIYMTPETRKHLDAIAKHQGVSISHVVKVLSAREYFRTYLDVKPAYVKPTVRDITAEVDIPRLRRDVEFDKGTCGFGADPTVIL